MKNKYLLFLVLFMVVGCSVSKEKTKKTTTVEEFSPLNDSYYASFNSNQARLHQLILGAFVAYDKKESEELQSWKVTETDSVILYSVSMGDISKEGYWIFSYEFMTSLPNNPIYSTIKQIVQKDRDTFEILYYKIPTKITLVDILEKNNLESIDLKKLEKTDKKTTLYKVSNVHFVGFSEKYEDKNCNCLRQNTYEITPKKYQVDASFFDLKDGSPIDKKNRPNVMLRRLINKDQLLKIAKVSVK